MRHIPNWYTALCAVLVFVISGYILVSCENGLSKPTPDGDEGIDLIGAVAVGARIKNAEVTAACGSGRQQVTLADSDGTDDSGDYAITIPAADAALCREGGIRLAAVFIREGADGAVCGISAVG